MNEITLRNGEVAFLPDGTIIMNDDTMIGLMNKLDALNDMAEEFDEYDDTLSQEDIDYYATLDEMDDEDAEDNKIEVELDDSNDEDEIEIEFIPEDGEEQEEVDENKKDESYLEALENVMVLLAKFFGPEILDKKISK